MRRPIILLSTIAIVLFISGDPLFAQKAKGSAAPEIVDGEKGKRIDDLLKGLDAEDGGFWGSALVAQGGKVIFEKSYGFIDDRKKQPTPVNALYDWGAACHQFVGAALLKLEMQKKLKIDDPLKKVFPKAPKNKADIPLFTFMTHTSGVEAGFKPEWYYDGRIRETFEDVILGLKVVAEPGKKYEWSNSGITFAAAICERAAGKPYDDFLKAEFFKPAGMTDTFILGAKEIKDDRVPIEDRGKGKRYTIGDTLLWGYRGCGGVVASCRDMFNWDRALRGDKILSKEAKEKFYKAGADGYSLGWFSRKGPEGQIVYHAGTPGKNRMYYLRAIEEDIVIALAYSYVPKIDTATTADRILEIVRMK